MRYVLSGALTALVLVGSGDALAEQKAPPDTLVITADQIDCRDWHRTPDGWGPTRPIQIKLASGGTIGMDQTSSFSGLPVDGMDLAVVLDQICGGK